MLVHVFDVSTSDLEKHVQELEVQIDALLPSKKWAVITPLTLRLHDANKELEARKRIACRATKKRTAPTRLAEPIPSKRLHIEARISMDIDQIAPPRAPMLPGRQPHDYAVLAEVKESPAYKSNPYAVISAVFNDKGAGPPFVVWDSPDAFIGVTVHELATMKSVADPLCLRPVYYMPDRPTSLYFDIDLSDKDVPRALGGAEVSTPTIEQLTDAFLSELQAFFEEHDVQVKVRQEAWIYAKPPVPGKASKASIHVHFPRIVAASMDVWRQLITLHLKPWLYVRAISGYAAKLPRGCLFIRKFDKNGKLHNQAWTAMDHSVYTKDRLFCPSGNGKPGRPRLEYSIALNAPSGRPVPSLHDQILASMSQSGVGVITFELPAHMRDTPSSGKGACYRQCVFPYMLGAMALRAKRSFGPDELCGEALTEMNPLHRLFTENKFGALADLVAADPICVRYNGILDLDAHFNSPGRKGAFLQSMRTMGIAHSAMEFTEFAELIAAARDAKEELTKRGLRHLVFSSGAGIRVLWEEQTLWIKCKFSEMPTGREVAELIAAKFPPTVRKFIDAGPYNRTGGTKSDLLASAKTGCFASPLSDKLPAEPQRTAHQALAGAIKSFWGRLLVTQPTAPSPWRRQIDPPVGQSYVKRLTTAVKTAVCVYVPEELVALVAAEATTVGVDVPEVVSTGQYVRLAYHGEHKCMAWRKSHSSNGGCVLVAADGTVRVKCFSERCKAAGPRIIGTIKVTGTAAAAAQLTPLAPSLADPAHEVFGHAFERVTIVHRELIPDPKTPGKAFIHPIDLISEPPRDVHVAAPKGAGKTFGIAQAIEQARTAKVSLSVIIPAPRRSLGKAHYGVLRQHGFVTYSEQVGNLYKCDRVLVEYESLTRSACNGLLRTYDLVVLDEPRCLIDAMHSSATNRGRIKENLQIFLHILRTAKRVCTIDADMLIDGACPRLINWLSQVRPSVHAELIVYPRKTERVFVMYNTETRSTWEAKFIKELEGQKLVTVCCDTRKRADRLEALAIKLGIRAGHILKYTRDTMPHLESTLLSPDANGWLTCKLVLFTSTITVGVSSQRTGVLFGALRHNTNNARLLEQMLSRVRNAESHVQILISFNRPSEDVSRPPTIETVRWFRRKRQEDLEKIMAACMSEEHCKWLQERPDTIFDALGDVVAWESEARRWPTQELLRVATYHGITVLQGAPDLEYEEDKKVDIVKECKLRYLRASAHDWERPRVLNARPLANQKLTAADHELLSVYHHMKHFKENAWTYDLYSTSSQPGAMSRAYTFKVAQHHVIRDNLREFRKRDVNSLKTCGYAEFFKPRAPVYLAATNVMRALGAKGILDDETVVEAKVVYSKKLLITAAAECCNTLLNTRIKPTGDAKCLSYVLKTLVGATFARDTTEKGFSVVISQCTAETAAHLAEFKSDDALMALFDAMDD